MPGVHNLMDIINDVLDMSKIETGHLEIEKTGFDLWEVVVSVQLAEKKVEKFLGKNRKGVNQYG